MQVYGIAAKSEDISTAGTFDVVVHGVIEAVRFLRMETVSPVCVAESVADNEFIETDTVVLMEKLAGIESVLRIKDFSAFYSSQNIGFHNLIFLLGNELFEIGLYPPLISGFCA